MLRTRFSLFCAGILFLAAGLQAQVTQVDRDRLQHEIDKVKENASSWEFSNGLRLICLPQAHTNNVTIGITYGVGSMHEGPGEYGMAHLLEHMMFKGTKTRGEGYIERVAKQYGKQLGYDYNATTGHDRTNYYFNIDNQNWKPFIDIMADVAQNLQFDGPMLDSELQAVFQEIKLGGHDGSWAMDAVFINNMPVNHPYGHLILGYKEELLNYSSDAVLDFYRRNYTPDNAVLLVAGNVDPEEVKVYAEKTFEGFTAKLERGEQAPQPFYTNFSQTNRVVYHTQQYHQQIFNWSGPVKQTVDAAAMSYVLVALSRRMQQEFVDAQGWCLHAGAFMWNLRLSGLVYACVVPKPEYLGIDYAAKIGEMITDIINNGVTDDEYTMRHRSLMHRIIRVSEYPGAANRYFTETFFPERSLDGAYQAAQMANNITQDAIKQAAYTYLRPFLMHSTKKVPLPQQEHAQWVALQQKADAHEKALLEKRKREVVSSPVSYDDATGLPQRHELAWADAPEPDELFELSNGLQVYYTHNAVSPKVTLSLVFKDSEAVRLAYGANRKKFAMEVWPEMVTHGTQTKTKQQFDDAMDIAGVSCGVGEGTVTMTALTQSFEKGCELLKEMLTQPAFPEDILLRKKAEFAQQSVLYKNDPDYQMSQYLKETLYAHYPWVFNEAQENENAQSVTLEMVQSFHDLMCDPSQVVCVVAGDMSREQVQELLEAHFASLVARGEKIAMPTVPAPQDMTIGSHLEVPIDQVHITALNQAVTCDHDDHPALLLLSVYLNTKVYEIREQTGLFYAGGYSYTLGTRRIPGTIRLKTLTGPTRAPALITRLKELLQTVHDSGIEASVLETMKKEWDHGSAVYAHTADAVAGHIGSCLRTDEEWQHAKALREKVLAVTPEQMNAVIARYFDPARWSFVTAGRPFGDAATEE